MGTRTAPLLDPGWLFLLSGCALLAATALIPARQDVQEARWQRERALAVEQHRLDRTAAYRNYLEALELGERPLIVSLAATQLNLAPKGMALLTPGAQTSQLDASVFTALEPPPPALPEWTRNESTLTRWTTDDRSRLWLIAGGAVCVLIGILPPARRG